MSRSLFGKSQFVCAAALAAASVAAPASAVVTWYSSKAAFLAAAPLSTDPTGMSGVTTDAQAVALMETAPSAWRNNAAQDQLDITLGSVKIVMGQGPITGHFFQMDIDGGTTGSSVGFTGASYRIGNPLNENHSYEIAGSGATAFGFAIFEPRGLSQCGGVPCVVSRFTFEAFDAANNSLGSNAFDFGDDPATQFIGLTSTTAFARYTVTETYLRPWTVPGYACCLYDNEYFGNYLMTSADAAGAVPEPTSWAMLLTGFGLIGGGARLRRRGAVPA